MEQEEWTLDENLGYTDSYPGSWPRSTELTGRDTYLLKFHGPKQDTKIPDVLVVWPNGFSEKRPLSQVRGIRRDGEKPVYKYCPIKLSDIHPETHREDIKQLARKCDVDFTPENRK